MSDPSQPNALTVALEFENRGRDFYARTAAEATDALSRKLFTTLGEDEVRHAEKIREIFSALSQGGVWPEPTAARQSRLESVIRSFFETNRDKLTPSSDHIAGYEFAMQMEKTGIDMYERFSRESENDAEKKFFAALLGEERGHLEALRNVYFFLTSPGDWYQEDESHHWNWMNL